MAEGVDGFGVFSTIGEAQKKRTNRDRDLIVRLIKYAVANRRNFLLATFALIVNSADDCAGTLHEQARGGQHNHPEEHGRLHLVAAPLSSHNS